MMYRIALNLFLIGHLLGDFYLQSSNLAKSKKHFSLKLIIHCIIYFASMLVVSIPIFNCQIGICVFVTSLSHSIVDYIKCRKELENESIIYCVDQLIHVLIILLVLGFMFINGNQINYIPVIDEIVNSYTINVESITAWILMILVIFKPISVTLKILLSKYQPTSIALKSLLNNSQNQNEMSKAKESSGIPNAGSFIGMLERSIILMMLFAGEYGAIGFVLTAKSIARYKKLSEDIQFSEYYLLGTLLSTALVIFFYYLIIQTVTL